MPGLVGISGQDSPDVMEHVRTMATRLGLGIDTCSLHEVQAPGIAMASDQRPTRLWGSRLAVDDQGIVVGINGEVFGLLDDEGNTTADFIRGPDSHPALDILQLYLQRGLDFIKYLRGYFSLVIWDSRTEILHLVSDRFALRQFFYYQKDGITIFGSEVKAILAGCATTPRLDEHGIADFLLLGMPLADRTFFKDIKLIPPASIITIRKSQLYISQYWHLGFNHQYNGLANPETAADRLTSVLEVAVNDCVNGPSEFELPLSGGLDSRCIGAIASRKVHLRSYTMGGNYSQDLQVGPLVASHLGISNETYQLTAQDFLDWIPASIYITDGMYSPVNAPILALARNFPSDAKVVLDGANSFDGYYKAYQIAMQRVLPRRYKALEMATGTVDQPVVDSRFRILKPLFSNEFLVESRQHLEATSQDITCSLESTKPGNHFDCMDFLDLSNRTRRFNMMGTVLLRAFCEVRQPLFDHRVVDLVTQLPLLFRSKEKLLMSRCLKKLDPYLAALPYERTGLPANAGLSRQLMEYFRRGLRKTASHALPGLREKPRVSIDYMHWIKNDETLQDYLRSVLLDPRSLSRSYIEDSRVEPFIVDLFNGQAENIFLTMRLLTMELWYRFFIEGESAPAFPQNESSSIHTAKFASPKTSYGSVQQRREAEQKT